MLHVRYDWRRPVFWAALCLTFFLSSQNSFNTKNDARPNELAKETTGKRSFAGNDTETKLYESSLSTYFFITKK